MLLDGLPLGLFLLLLSFCPLNESLLDIALLSVSVSLCLSLCLCLSVCLSVSTSFRTRLSVDCNDMIFCLTNSPGKLSVGIRPRFKKMSLRYAGSKSGFITLDYWH